MAKKRRDKSWKRHRDRRTSRKVKRKVTNVQQLTELYQRGERDFTRASLVKTDLCNINLQGANLYRANLREAKLVGANLDGASLNRVHLKNADLSEANLHGVRLEGADLRGAKVTDEQLAQAVSLKGAILPDGTTHD